MPSKCCVPNCTTGRVRCVEKVSCFKTSDENLQKRWTAAIPRKGFKVTNNTSVCALHFHEEDIVREQRFIIGGESVNFPYLHPRLKPGSVPSLFPGCPLYLSKPRKHRKPPAVRGEVPAPKKRRQSNAKTSAQETSGIQCSVEPGTDTELLTGTKDSNPSLPNQQALVPAEDEVFKIQNYIGQLDLPAAWSIMARNEVDNSPVNIGEDGQYILSKHCLNDERTVLEKSIVVAGSKLDFRDSNNRVITETTLAQQVASITEFKHTVKMFDEMKICPGVTDKDLLTFTSCVRATKYGSYCWKSDSCEKILQTGTHAKDLCENCSTLRRYLKSRKQVQADRNESTRKKQAETKRILRRKVTRYEIRIKKLKLKLKLAKLGGKVTRGKVLQKEGLVTAEAIHAVPLEIDMNP